MSDSGRQPGLFLVLRHRGFRLLWSAQLLSGCGVWVQNLAAGWFISEHQNSSVLLGLLGCATLAPVMFVALVGGALADRMDRRRVLLICQVILTAATFALAALAISNRLEWWHFTAAALVSGFAVALNAPAYHALVADLVPRDELSHAVALNSVQFNVARIVGHATAGLVLLAAGLAGCFLLNALSYIPILVVLLMLPALSGHERWTSKPLIGSVRQGVSFLRERGDSLRQVLLVACISLFGLPYFFLLPQFGRDVLRTDACELGILTAAVSVGGLAGGLLLGIVTEHFGRAHTSWIAGGLFWAHLAGFALSRSYVLSLVLLVGLGLALVLSFASVTTTLQLMASTDMRGRVMSVFQVAANGPAPIGSLLLGFLASRVSPAGGLLVMTACGAACTAALMLVRQHQEELTSTSERPVASVASH